MTRSVAASLNLQHLCFLVLIHFAIFWMVLISGCARDRASDLFASVNDSNIQRVANLYCVYQAQHNFIGPSNEEQFKEFIASMPASRLKYYGVRADKVDELFISERDKQPFKIRWELRAKSRQGPIPIAFESEGRNGQFLVGFSSFQVREVNQFEYEELWSGKRDQDMPDESRGAPMAGR